jgi:hypothetical protein
MGNGNVEKTTKIGDISGTVCDKNGNKLNHMIMKDMAVVPNSRYNQFSLTKAMNASWILSGQNNRLTLKKDQHEIIFDIEIPTPKGVIYAMYMKYESEIAGAVTDKKTKLTIQQAHDKLGHCDEDLTRKAANQLEWELTPGSLGPFEACAARKARQKNIPKHCDDEKIKKVESQIYLDIATVKHKEGRLKALKLNWRIMVNERTQLKFSNFYLTKNRMVEPTCKQFQKWKQVEIQLSL